jgi:hypothetical protein
MTSMTLKRPSPIDANIYDSFLDEVGRRRGAREGSVRSALEEAVNDWIKSKPKKTKTRDRSK